MIFDQIVMWMYWFHLNPAAPWSLFDLVTMQDELQRIFGRPVDLVEREGLRNPFRKRSILNSREVIYASPGT